MSWVEEHQWPPKPYKRHAWGKDIQPWPFNHVCCEDVRPITRSYIGWKGGGRTHPKQHHPNPQGQPFSIKIWLTTGTLPLSQHSLDSFKMHTVPFHPTMAWPTSWVSGATPPTHNHQPFKSRQVPVQPDTALNRTLVLKLINQQTKVWMG